MLTAASKDVSVLPLVQLPCLSESVTRHVAGIWFPAPSSVFSTREVFRGERAQHQNGVVQPLSDLDSASETHRDTGQSTTLAGVVSASSHEVLRPFSAQ
jgi:hypothetical protein